MGTSIAHQIVINEIQRALHVAFFSSSFALIPQGGGEHEF